MVLVGLLFWMMGAIDHLCRCHCFDALSSGRAVQKQGEKREESFKLPSLGRNWMPSAPGLDVEDAS